MAILLTNVRSTNSCCRKRVIQRVDELDSTFEKFVVRDRLFSPTVQHGIDAKSFLTAKLFIQEIGIVDGLADHCDFAVTNVKCLLQGLESAVFAPVTEAAGMKHVEGNRFAGNVLLRRKSEPRFFVDVTPNQPRAS